MEIVAPFICKQEEETVNDVLSQRACELSGTIQDRLTCSCRHHDCPNNGTKCFDNPDEPGIVQLSCLREKPSLSLFSTCCLLGYLKGICAFYRERL
jgi:hypothetical protein